MYFSTNQMPSSPTTNPKPNMTSWAREGTVAREFAAGAVETEEVGAAEQSASGDSQADGPHSQPHHHDDDEAQDPSPPVVQPKGGVQQELVLGRLRSTV